MWSHARYDLGLSEAEFWSSTPRQIQYLDKRYAQRLEREEFYSAQVSSTICNNGFKQYKEPIRPADFMPSQHIKPQVQEPVDDNELVRKINAIMMPRSIPKKKE